jgi:hypothetical protein
MEKSNYITLLVNTFSESIFMNVLIYFLSILARIPLALAGG